MKIAVQLLLLIAAVAGGAWADEREDAEKLELERQQKFRSAAEAMVDDFNDGSFDRLIAMIDQDDLVDRIFGLRLIDQQVKKQFRENLEWNYERMIESGFPSTEDAPLTATLLGVESRGERGRAVVRFDLPKLQFSYYEFELGLDKKDNVDVIDWTDYLGGQKFTDNVGLAMVMSAPSKPALRKLVDYQQINERDLFQFGELLKAAQRGNLKRYLEIHAEMTERLQEQRIVIETSVRLARQVRNRRKYVEALKIMAERYPDEPLYALLLMDYFLPTKQYEMAVAALQALYRELGFEDAAMEARLSAVALIKGSAPDALAMAERAIELEPDLELAWWSALRARTAVTDYPGAVEALAKLEGGFGHELGPEAFAKDASFAELLASSEYQTWLESR